jgi:hypothetical protein
VQGFAEEKLGLANLRVLDAELRLEGVARELWMNYIYTPAQQLMRGRLDDCLKRLVRIKNVIDDARGTTLDPAEIAKWQKRVRDAYLKKDNAQISEIWSEDQWLRQLVGEPDDEPANPRLVPKKILSDMVLRALSEPMQLKCDYLLALRWHELAERLQVQAGRGAAGNAGRVAKAKQDAKAAWTNANSRWSGYEHDNPLSAETVRARMETARKYMQANKPLAVGLLEYQDRVVREGVAARLTRARALEALGQNDVAGAALKRLENELAALESQKLADFSPAGSLFWLRYSASLKQVEQN